ncbi:protein of unknown function (plasmid) [Rhodovastum atsumiense]|nr:protein of unknown function [Rhodovastum atsumiense]
MASSGFCCKLGEQLERFLGRTEIQAAMSNKLAMNAAWAFMSRPSILRTCPFLIIAIGIVKFAASARNDTAGAFCRDDLRARYLPGIPVPSRDHQLRRAMGETG